MDNKIIDGMKKESKNPRNAMILCYLFAVLMPLVLYSWISWPIWMVVCYKI